MRKRILSLLLCCVMLIGLLPTTAFAEDSAEEPPVCICETACTVDNMNKECPVCGAKNAIPQNCGQYIPVEDRTGENSSTEGANDPNGPTELGAADQVQAMIDDLPGTDEITDDNAEEVEAQLEAIDEAKKKLSDEEIDELDMTRYAEAAAALGALAAPMLLANDSPDEQFSLKPGDTYYFDLSGADIPGTANSGNSYGAASLPDTSLHYVPFTYAGTIEAYKLTSEMATTEEYAQQNKYAHSLFVADYNVTRSANWHNLNAKNLIFGKAYTSGGVDYTLRVPSAGSGSTGSKDSERGTPLNNEWDAILDKANQSYQDNTVGYIKNWNGMDSWGQDTHDGPDPDWNRATRGSFTARSWQFDLQVSPSVGFRPVLELPSSDTLGSDDLTTVTLDLNGGSIGSITGTINLAVKSDFNLTLPGGTDVTRPDGNDGTYFMWQDSSRNLYEPGDTVPANVGRLTAQWEGWTKLTKDILDETYKRNSVGAYYYVLPSGHYYLGEDISVDIGIDIGTYATPANVTLDLNGHELKDVSNNTAGSLIYFPSTSSTNTLTLMDSSSGKTGKVIRSSGTTAKLSKNAKLNANGGTIEGLVELVDNTAVIDNTDPSNVTVFTGWVSLYDGTIKGGIFTGTVGIGGGTISDSAKVTVAFDSDGGSDVAEQKVLRGQKVSEPTAPTKAGYEFAGWYNGDTKYDFTQNVTENITLTAKWESAKAPVITGLENNKTYCDTVEFEVSDNVGVASVQVDGVEWTLDANNQFTLSPAEGTQTIVVTDKAGNRTTVSVTVNNGHIYEWQSENGQYWQKCKFCNHETAKKDIPTINISGADKVCRTQDYKFSFTLPEGATDAVCGYEFIGLGGAPLTPTVENGLYSGIIKASTYPAKENIFKLIVSVKTADGFAFSAEKKVTIQNEHTGGTATCKDKAKCEVCGESYGKLDSNNHANLKHIDAKAATKTSEGNIEYWYCNGCNKCYKDAAAATEIALSDTVIAKRIPRRYSGPTITVMGAAYYDGGNVGLTFVSSADFDTFTGVQVDGKTLAAKNYIAERGSIEVYLKAVYLRTLKNGSHTVTIQSTAGDVSAVFTVENSKTSPGTSDPGVAVYALSSMLSLAGLAALRRRKED